MVSIAVHWPLLGVVVGAGLGQGRRWRRDPALLRAYSRGSWIWVGQYASRLVVFIPLYLTDQVMALVVARVAMTWPLVVTCLAVSWWMVRRSLPADHPGLPYPQVETPIEGAPASARRVGRKDKQQEAGALR